MSSLNCLNCGAPLENDYSSKYIKCKYCKTINSNFTPIERIDDLLKDTNEPTDLIKSLQMSYKLKDYETMKTICMEILNKNHNSWVAFTYLAVSEFWLGYDDYRHIDKVKEIILKAKILSNENELVIDIADKIANNIILLASKNEVYGEEFQDAIYAINIAREISSLDTETIETLNKYLEESFIYQYNNLNSMLIRDKIDYDPPYISLQNIYELCLISNKLEFLEFFYLHAKVHLSNGKTKSYYNDLFEQFRG
jgi:hypothetical protein